MACLGQYFPQAPREMAAGTCPLQAGPREKGAPTGASGPLPPARLQPGATGVPPASARRALPRGVGDLKACLQCKFNLNVKLTIPEPCQTELRSFARG